MRIIKEEKKAELGACGHCKERKKVQVGTEIRPVCKWECDDKGKVLLESNEE